MFSIRFSFMSLQAGDVFAFKVNAHRSFWSGDICSSAAEWKCGAEESFRVRDCANGVRSCFHLNLFSPTPRFVIPDPGVVRLFAEHQSLFDNQIIFFFGQNFDLEKGRQDHLGEAYFGAYRVKRAKLQSVNQSGGSNLVIEPYPGEWAIFPHNRFKRSAQMTPPVLKDVPYMRRMDGQDARQLINRIQESIPESGLRPEQKKQLRRFCTSFPHWQKDAESALQGHPLTQVFRSDSTAPVETPIAAKMKNLLGDIQVREAAPDPLPVHPPSAQPIPSGSKPEPELAAAPQEKVIWNGPSLPEAGCIGLLGEKYGQGLIQALQIGSLSKSLLIFTGPPGVGKSWIAGRLIDDAECERSVIVPVSSTWRGREDLLGYVNPVNGEFEPTDFTRFLLRAERAWDTGDRRNWLVVFEEFNLSQPEHWLSDLLVRLEYDPGRRADRTIALGGNGIAGEPESRTSQVFLPPNLVLVATLNNDHTVRPLSPRVLDRSALIEISVTGRSALELVDSDWPVEVKERVEDLNRILESRGVSFSVRSARSLQRASQSLGADQLLTVLDHVLLQEVLSKVRLMAGDSRDEKLLRDLLAWSEDERCAALALSRRRIAAWNEALNAGRDVFQA